MSENLLESVDLVKRFPLRRGFFGQHKLSLLAVDRVSLTLRQSETLGVVGESGSGKSTLALTLMQLYTPSSGQVRFAGQELVGLDERKMFPVRRQMQMIFQDPFAALDPRLTVGQCIREPLDIHGVGTPPERDEMVQHLIERVGLSRSVLGRYPNEFSGGQQQRIGIARALALRPQLMICDEPVSALDVSVQAQILNLLRDLQDEFKLSYLFISHNIAITAFMSHRIGVMYLGRLVEIAPSRQIVAGPRHPYTQALLAAVPEPDPTVKKRERPVRGDIPSPIDRPTGCAFHPRCPLAQAICKEQEPELRLVAGEHFAACHFA